MARQPSVGWACGWLVSAVFWSWVENKLWFSWPFPNRKMKCACTLGSRAPATFSESAELSCACPSFRHEKFTEPTRYGTRTVSKSAMFLQRKVWSQRPRPSRGEKLRCKFLARKRLSAKLFVNTKVDIFGKERCKTHRQFQPFAKERCKIHRHAKFSATIMTSLPSRSLSPYLSLSPSAPHAQYRNRFRASFNTGQCW